MATETSEKILEVGVFLITRNTIGISVTGTLCGGGGVLKCLFGSAALHALTVLFLFLQLARFLLLSTIQIWLVSSSSSSRSSFSSPFLFSQVLLNLEIAGGACRAEIYRIA